MKLSVGVRGAICIEGLAEAGIAFDNTGDFGGYGEIGWGTGVEVRINAAKGADSLGALIKGMGKPGFSDIRIEGGAYVIADFNSSSPFAISQVGVGIRSNCDNPDDISVNEYGGIDGGVYASKYGALRIGNVFDIAKAVQERVTQGINAGRNAVNSARDWIAQKIDSVVDSV